MLANTSMNVSLQGVPDGLDGVLAPLARVPDALLIRQKVDRRGTHQQVCQYSSAVVLMVVMTSPQEVAWQYLSYSDCWASATARHMQVVTWRLKLQTLSGSLSWELWVMAAAAGGAVCVCVCVLAEGGNCGCTARDSTGSTPHTHVQSPHC